ncbi:MAG: hemolysin III family protein, partial [Phaeodactylibacter sp.]|nr:hemolysin III family protein [Phaeodactylibacter sp.]
MAHRDQSPEEEKVNVYTQGFGFLLGLGLLPLLLFKLETHLMLWCVAVFGIGFLMCYLSSTLYHWATDPKLKKRLQIWDHISIFILIGGTYMPVVFRYLDYGWAVVFMVTMWSIILAGSVLKLYFTGKYMRLSVVLYLLLGWMAVFIIKPLMAVMPLYVFWWILAGGLSYSIGV